jgi:cell division protein FtsB
MPLTRAEIQARYRDRQRHREMMLRGEYEQEIANLKARVERLEAKVETLSRQSAAQDR